MSENQTNNFNNFNENEETEPAIKEDDTVTSYEKTEAEPAETVETYKDTEVCEPKKHRPVRVSLFTFVLSTVSLVLAAVMITYTLCTAAYKQKLNGIIYDNAISGEAYDTSGEKLNVILSEFINK